MHCTFTTNFSCIFRFERRKAFAFRYILSYNFLFESRDVWKLANFYHPSHFLVRVFFAFLHYEFFFLLRPSFLLGFIRLNVNFLILFKFKRNYETDIHRCDSFEISRITVHSVLCLCNEIRSLDRPCPLSTCYSILRFFLRV